MTPHIALPALPALMLPLALLLALLDDAQAQSCSPPPSPLTGTWHNPDARTHELVRLELVEVCEGVEPGVFAWRAYAWGRCARSQCRWGAAPAMSDSADALRVRFDTFAARRYLRIDMASDDLLQVEYLIDYRSSGRERERGNLQLVPAR